MRVLIVEDDPIIAGNLYDYLEARGFEPDAAHDGRAALALLRQQPFDAVILDIGLPGMNGYAVLHVLRDTLNLRVPVLVLTARDALEDKLAGFAHGADDYLTKPFALAEVEARLLALRQRARPAAAPADSVDRKTLHYGALSFDPRSQTVSVAGAPVHLTRKSIAILNLLLRDPGRMVSREELEDALWGGEPPSLYALRSQMHLLRRALSDAGFDRIETVHGCGWRLV